MKKQEVIEAAKKFIQDHKDGYIKRWQKDWDDAVDSNQFPADNFEHNEWKDANAVVNFFQAFYDNLPESPQVRGYGFGALCDICEHIFGFDDDEK